MMTLVIALVSAGLVLACAGEAGRRGWAGSVTDSAGVTIVSNPVDGLWGDDAEWRAVEDLSIGMIEGPAEYTFAQVADVAVDRGDTIYVLDRGDKIVKVYDPAGRYVRAFGREGQGPGEFQEPDQIASAGERLSVYDWRALRLTHFASRGAVLGTGRVDTRSPFAAGLYPLGDSTLLLGLVAGHSMPPDPEREGKFWLVRVALGGTILDTLLTAAGFEAVPYRTEQLMMVIGGPFARGPRWSVAPDGRIAFGRGETYDLAIYQYPEEVRDEAGSPLPARLTARIRRAGPLLPATPEDIQAYRDGYLGREGLSAESRRQYETVLETVTYPKTWPAFVDLVFDGSGRLWAKRPAHYADTLAAWDVFGPDGRYLGAVELPKALSIHAITTAAAYGVLRDELDVQYVKRYRLERRR